MIFIRVDANSKIGMGHMMRCLSLADAFLKAGKDVAFICAKDTDCTVIKEKGYGYCVLSSSYNEMMSEIPAITEALMSMGAELLIVDSYQVSKDYFFALKPFTKLCLIEDIPGSKYAVDYLINYNLYAKEEEYRDVYPYTKLLLGPNYAPVRDEFRQAEYTVRDKIETILVTTGGSDMYNLSSKISEYLLNDDNTKNLHINIVSGALNTHLDELKKINKAHTNVNLIVNANNMAELMRESDLVISAAGSTVLELLCVGVPFVCISFVDNQKRIFEYCKCEELSIAALDYEAAGEEIFAGMIQAVKMAIEDNAKRKSLSEKGKSIVDGKGASRIVKELLKDL